MSGQDEPRPTSNPFSPVAVARIGPFTADEVTIETEAIRQATGLVSSYLASVTHRPDTASVGDVIAVVGDYGTGKTHLAMQLVRIVGQVPGDRVQAIYLDATADTFFALYRNFMRKLGLDGVRRRVSDYYADIVADWLRESGLDEESVRSIRNQEPRKVVERLGLMESDLLRRVQQKLNQVTANASFVTALTLLLRGGFDDAVLDWLTGERPDQILVERGVTEQIVDEVAALEAMGVIALLYGGKHHGFVLVIDELDKVLSATRQPADTVMAAFQKLLQVFSAAGTFLVLSGLPDFLQVLPNDMRERIGQVITMSGLGTDEVCRFIERTQQLAFGTPALAPFSRDTVGYIVRLAGGVPRRMIRLCHHLYRMAADRDTDVTDTMVREAARATFGLLGVEDVGSTVRRVLVGEGWNSYSGHFLGMDPDSRADFWVTFGDGATGCAVLLTESVLDSNDVEQQLRRAAAIQAAAQDAELLLVINGIVPPELAAQLRDPFGREPLVYDDRSFADDLRAVLGAIARRLDTIAHGDPLAVMLQRLERISRQQTSMYGFMEQLTAHVENSQSVIAGQFDNLRRELVQLSEAVLGGPGNGAAEAQRDPLPAEADEIFADAVAVLDDLVQAGKIADSFTGAGNDQDEFDAREAMRVRLRSREALTATGVALLLRRAVVEFRSGVADLLRAGPANGDRTDRLDLLCRAYDDISEYLPLFMLEPLFPGAEPGGDADDVVTGVRRRTIRGRVADRLDNLSPRVRQAVVRALRR